MRLVKLVRNDDEAVWVNPAHVVSVQPAVVAGQVGTRVALLAELLYVRGAPADVAKALA